MKLWIVNLRFKDSRETIDVSVILNLPANLRDPLNAVRNNLDWIHRIISPYVAFEVVSILPFNTEQQGVV